MRAISAILICLSLLSLIVLSSFAQRSLNVSIQSEFSITKTINPETFLPAHARYYLPFANNNSLYLTPAPMRTATSTPTLSSFKPDLIPLDFKIFGCCWDCFLPSHGEISGQVLNKGDGNSGEFQIQYSHQEYIPFIGPLKVIDGLSAGESIEFNWQFIPGSPIVYVSVEVDPGNQVEEMDESNNQFLLIRTPPPYCTTITPVLP